VNVTSQLVHDFTLSPFASSSAIGQLAFISPNWFASIHARSRSTCSVPESFRAGTLSLNYPSLRLAFDTAIGIALFMGILMFGASRPPDFIYFHSEAGIFHARIRDRSIPTPTH
jgi:hypothetical protein